MITIIVPSRTESYTRRLLASLHKSSPDLSRYKVIIIDNGMDKFNMGGVEFSPDQIEVGDHDEFANVSIYQYPRGVPFVFALAVNMGIARADESSDIIVQNDDTEILSPAFIEKVEAILGDPAFAGFGILSPQISGSVGNLDQNVDNPIPVGSVALTTGVVCFISAIIRRSVINSVGKLNEAYVYYGWDDSEYNRRVVDSGLMLGVIGGITVNHHGDGGDVRRSGTYRKVFGEQAQTDMFYRAQAMFQATYGDGPQLGKYATHPTMLVAPTPAFEGCKNHCHTLGEMSGNGSYPCGTNVTISDKDVFEDVTDVEKPSSPFDDLEWKRESKTAIVEGESVVIPMPVVPDIIVTGPLLFDHTLEARCLKCGAVVREPKGILSKINFFWNDPDVYTCEQCGKAGPIRKSRIFATAKTREAIFVQTGNPPARVFDVGKDTDIESDVDLVWALTRLGKCRKVLEIGTRQGISTRVLEEAVFGDGLRTGDLIAIDPDPGCKAYLQGVCATFLCTTGEDYFQNWDDVPEGFDCILLDVDPHTYEQTMWFLENYTENRLRIGGLMLFHDIVQNRPEICVKEAVREFIARERDRWLWVEFPLRDVQYRWPQGGIGALWKLS